jgi:hypothetical protein
VQLLVNALHRESHLIYITILAVITDDATGALVTHTEGAGFTAVHWVNGSNPRPGAVFGVT